MMRQEPLDRLIKSYIDITRRISFHSEQPGRARTSIKWSRFEVADKGHQLLVARGLAELPLGLRRVEHVLALEVHRAHDCVCERLDGDLLLFADGEDDGLDGVVLAELPDEELREVAGVDELPEWLSCPTDNEGRPAPYEVVVTQRSELSSAATHAGRGSICGSVQE